MGSMKVYILLQTDMKIIKIKFENQCVIQISNAIFSLFYPEHHNFTMYQQWCEVVTRGPSEDFHSSCKVMVYFWPVPVYVVGLVLFSPSLDID